MQIIMFRCYMFRSLMYSLTQNSQLSAFLADLKILICGFVTFVFYQVVYKATTFAGLTGLFTAQKPGVLTFSLDERGKCMYLL